MVLLAKTLKNHYSAYKSNFDFLWFDHRTTLFCNLVHGFWSLDKFNNKGSSQWGIPQSGIFLSATYKAVLCVGVHVWLHAIPVQSLPR